MMMMYEDGFALDGMTVEGYMNSPFGPHGISCVKALRVSPVHFLIPNAKRMDYACALSRRKNQDLLL
ncbi:unnamed protein product [Pleuronectes platessa]|uniref:Uncharacterized protein n=1 Tax=Pleuronectes platessa TaxID=8262 RepID=A0A9N7TYX3_PLEPL|nr:unnamed protein product [Pleuronectes platessa]